MQKRDEIFINFTPLLCMLFVCMLYDVVFTDLDISPCNRLLQALRTSWTVMDVYSGLFLFVHFICCVILLAAPMLRYSVVGLLLDIFLFLLVR